MANHAPPCELSLSIARCSHCPASTWQDVARDVLLRDAQVPAFLVNVGANKGYNVNEFLSRFHRTWHVSNQNWLSYLTSDAVGMSRNYSCGACHACNTPPPLRDNRSLHAEKVKVVAVELASSNAAVLRAAFSRFHVPGIVVHAGGSNSVGVARVNADEPLGIETARLDESPTALNGFANSSSGLRARLSALREGGQFSTKKESKLESRLANATAAIQKVEQHQVSVQMTTVDAHLANSSYGVHSLAQLARHTPHQAIGLLSVDTEGHDALVLQGARNSFTTGAFQVIEFEYHSIDPWPSHDLHTTVTELDEAGYACFWQGNGGALAPVLRRCTYQHMWSNIVCVARRVRGLEAAMRQLVPATSTAEVPLLVQIASSGANYTRPCRPPPPNRGAHAWAHGSA